MRDAAKNVDILAINLRVLHNYFDSLIKLFSDLYLAKYTFAKSFFSCISFRYFHGAIFT